MSDEFAVQQVLARYVRATDSRNGSAMSELFVPNGRVDIYTGQGTPERLGTLEGAETIGQAVAGMMAAHPARGWSHHVTSDHLVEISGDEATLDAQFIMFETRGDERPAQGWPAGAFGAQGTVRPREAGYYRSKLVRVDGHWRIAHHAIYLDLPHAFGGNDA